MPNNWFKPLKLLFDGVYFNLIVNLTEYYRVFTSHLRLKDLD